MAPPTSSEDKSTSPPKPALYDIGWSIDQAAAAIGCGLVFGWSLHKGDVYRVEVIRDQFRFANLTMLKVFLSASATSVVSMMVLYNLKSTRERARAFGDVVYRNMLGLPATALGATLLGVGMAISGSCPGTIWAQLGAGSLSSLATLGGALAASVSFGFLHPTLSPFLSWAPTDKKWIGDWLSLSPGSTSMLLVGLFAAVIAAAEYVQPSPGYTSPLLTSTVWPPALCGAMIGALQIPLMALTGKSVGTSSSFVTVSSSMLSLVTGKLTPYMKAFSGGFINWWQVLFVLSAAGGSYLAYSSAPRDVLYDVGGEVGPLASFVGGFLAVFGARIANGCTSGHGISGMGHQSTRSLLAVACMFAGGIATTLLLL